MAIAAISTSQNNSSIGIVRLSGEDCFKILDKIFKPKNDKQIKGYSIKYGHIYDKNEIIDEVLVSYFIAPKSYTTENMVEINSHGGRIVLNKILDLVIENGARLAMPGEFTKLAFLNGRIDLTQAESVIDIINSSSLQELKSSQNALNGGLRNKLSIIKDKILEILTNIEVSIDYPEYDVPEVQYEEILNMLNNIKLDINYLVSSYKDGKIIKERIKTALIGVPNAGKSSLLNSLLNENRSIVTSVAGTTRDTIEESISINGIKFKLIDTAGIRESSEEVELIGIKKSIGYITDADLVIYIIDSSKELNNDDVKLLEQIKDKNYIICLNKIDINNSSIKNIKDYLNKQLFNNIIEISAKNNIGIVELKEKIEKIFKLNDITQNDSIYITNARHEQLLKRAIENIDLAIEDINNNIPIDLISIKIKDVLYNLNEITGENVTEDIINNIFSKFCLGK